FPVRTGLQFISLTASILYTLGLRKGYLYGVAIGVQLEIVLLVEPVGTVPPNFAKRLADVVAVHPLGRPVSGDCWCCMGDIASEVDAQAVVKPMVEINRNLPTLGT